MKAEIRMLRTGGEEGFTLLETLVAFAILASALLIMLQGISLGARQYNAAVDALAAGELADRAMAMSGPPAAQGPAGRWSAETTQESREISVGGSYAGHLVLRRVEIVSPEGETAWTARGIAAMAIAP